MLQATATYQACQTIGMPECRINLAVSFTSFVTLSLQLIVSIVSHTWPKHQNPLEHIMPTNV